MVTVSGTTPGSTATYDCVEGYDLVGSSDRVCQNNGQWTNTEPSCRSKYCYAVVVVVVLLFLMLLCCCCCCCCCCHCATSPAVVDCGPLPDPSGGRVVITTTIFQSVATYRCNPGFELVGTLSRTCQADGTWSETDPTCDCKQI